MTTDRLVIEFVAPDDPMFRLLTRGNEHLYKYLTRDQFENQSKRYFVIERTEQVGDSNRWLYQMRRAESRFIVRIPVIVGGDSGSNVGSDSG